MGDCTTCRFDTETLNCKQGHMRDWHHELGLEKGKRIPIQSCHAWEEKECSCSNIRWSRGATDIFDVTCKKCGRKLAGEKPILSKDCVCQIAKFFKGELDLFNVICRKCGRTIGKEDLVR